jgi:hypothetical protein
LESLRKQVAAWKKENERAERIKNPPHRAKAKAKAKAGAK